MMLLLRSLVRTAGNQRAVVCASGCIVHTPAIVQPHALPYAIFNSGHPLHTNCHQFTDSWGVDGLADRVHSRGLNQRSVNSCAVKHDGARPNPFGHAYLTIQVLLSQNIIRKAIKSIELNLRHRLSSFLLQSQQTLQYMQIVHAST